MTFAPAKFEIATSNSLGEDAFTRKYIIWPWPWGQGHTKCCPVPSTSCDLCTYRVWYCYIPLLRRRCIYKKYIKWPWPSGQGHTKCCPVPSTSCDLCTYRVLSYYVKSFRRRSIYKKINVWPLTLTLGSRSDKMLPSALYIMWPMHLKSLK